MSEQVLALDVGDKTIGVAVSDPGGVVAEPVTVIERTASVKADLRSVEELAHRYEACEIVVGIPIMLDGSEGVQAGKAREFSERLAKRVRVPVVTWDERLTTVEAERALMEANTSRSKRKQVVDKLAAAIILRSYLAARKEETDS